MLLEIFSLAALFGSIAFAPCKGIDRYPELILLIGSSIAGGVVGLTYAKGRKIRNSNIKG